MTFCSRLVLLLAGALALAAGASALPDAPEWEIELLPADPLWNVVNATDINSRGWITGYGGPTYRAVRPVLWRDDGYVDLIAEFPGAEGYETGQAADINERGLVGGVISGDAGTVAVLWDGRRGTTEIVHPDAADVPGYTFTHSQITSVNDHGEATGMLRNFTGGSYQNERAYVWRRLGRPGTLLPIPDAYVASTAWGISDRGVVGGQVWDRALVFDYEACAWLEGRRGEYEFVNIHALLAEEEPAIVRSFVTCVDDKGRVYGMGQTSAFQAFWTFVWDERDGLRFLDTDATAGQVWGASERVLAGLRGTVLAGDIVAVAWIREEPYVLPQLPGHAGHWGTGANTQGDVVGYAMRPGNVFWWQGSDAWVATRVHGCR